MDDFLTEKTIEGYLEHEKRALTLPGGSTHETTATNITWAQFDGLITAGAFTPEELIQMTVDWLRDEPKLGFNTCFSALIAFIYPRIKADNSDWLPGLTTPNSLGPLVAQKQN